MQPTAPAAGIAAFGHDLLVALATRRPGANVVVSPASIATCFAMLRPGAGGSTGAQIDSVMHFLDAGTGAAYARLAADWASPQLSLASGVWLQEGMSVREEYLRAVEADFGAVVRRVDFASPTALEAMNAWVRQRTHGLIDTLLEQAPARTGVVLANAVHLKADWQRPFDATATAERPFRLADGREVLARTMSALATFDLATDEGWRAVRLPYADCDLALWVLVPEPGADPLGLLAPTVLARAREIAHPERLQLLMPGWRVRSDLDLNAALGTLGMRAPFEPGADFAALSPDVERISAVVHRAVMAVDEQGTLAAAVTGIAMRAVSMPAPGIPVLIDRPFGYALVHEPTGTPVFSGVVHDPRA
ncbi:MAG: serpin family protein [Actinomycetota bacterium]|nr:serpin family protein [Actinomycetota bacterium]